jgi:hypothetical protein
MKVRGFHWLAYLAPNQLRRPLIGGERSDKSRPNVYKLSMESHNDVLICASNSRESSFKQTQNFNDRSSVGGFLFRSSPAWSERRVQTTRSRRVPSIQRRWNGIGRRRRRTHCPIGTVTMGSTVMLGVRTMMGECRCNGDENNKDSANHSPHSPSPATCRHETA